MKPLSKLALVILCVALLVSQTLMLSSIKNLKNEINLLNSMVMSVQSSTNAQINSIARENADYLLDSIEAKHVSTSKTAGVVTVNMSIGFSKLPSDAKVLLDIKSTDQHYENPYLYYSGESVPEIVYAPAHQTELLAISPMQFSTELVLPVEKNYELSAIIVTPDKTYSEVLGIIPLYDWSDNAYALKVDYNHLGVKAPDHGSFKCSITLAPQDLSQEYFTLTDKSLLSFKALENPFLKAIKSATYTVYYDDEVIQTGPLEAQKFADETLFAWQATSEATFTADINSDYGPKLRIEVKTVDEENCERVLEWHF